MDQSVYFPVSLGNTCECKFQVARVLNSRRNPAGSPLGFRLKMTPPSRGRDLYRWDLFDWQGTSFRTLLEYLKSDFRGVFEREDLDTGGVGVMHRTLGTQHIHDFEVMVDYPREQVTPQVVDQGYPAVRKHFDEMAEDFRLLLTQPGPFLYIHVCEDIPKDWEVWRLINLLSARSAEHRFHLLFVGYEDEDTSDFSGLQGWVSKAYKPRTNLKPQDLSWEGDDAAWDAALAPFALAFPDGSSADPSGSPVLAPMASSLHNRPAQVAAEPRQSLLRRLLRAD